jgi:general secretion pathway protein A
MYEKFYGLSVKPFAVSPDPAFLYLGRHHRHALTLLQYAIHEAAGFALVTGEVGCGKTTVVQHFLDRPGSGLRVGYMCNTHPGMGPLLPWIIEAMGGDVDTLPTECYRRFVALARSEYQAGRRMLLVIDEAQNLSVQQLEELRVLSNLNAGREMLLQVILVGQPELRATLGSAQLRQFAQRILMDYHVGTLHVGETQDYVRHRLKTAGGSPALFTPEAVCRVHEAGGGTPRVINILCDNALLYGFAERRSDIDAEVIAQVLQDRAGSVLPLHAMAG